MSSFCLLPLTYGCLFLGLVGTVVENGRQGLLILTSLKFSCGRLAEETLLGRRVWGDYKSRCIGGGVVVALVRAFVRPISEMKGKVEDKRHSRLRLRWPYRKKATTTGPVDREQAFIRIRTRHSANENLRGGVRRMTILRDDRLERVSSGSGTPSLVGYG